MTVQSYFDAKALTYDSWWNRFLLKDIEKTRILSLIGEDLAGQNVVEVACGTGFYSSEILKRKPSLFVANDLSQAMLDQMPNQGVTKISGDFLETIFQHQFNRIFCFGGLEFIENVEAFFQKAQSISFHGAKLYILIPNRGILSSLYRRHYLRQGLRITRFDKESLLRFSQRTSWRLISYHWVSPVANLAIFSLPGTVNA